MGLSSFLDRAHTVAKPGFSRWMPVVGVLRTPANGHKMEDARCLWTDRADDLGFPATFRPFGMAKSATAAKRRRVVRQPVPQATSWSTIQCRVSNRRQE